jgi:hypothetical protein
MAAQQQLSQYQALMHHLSNLPANELEAQLKIEATFLAGTKNDLQVLGIIEDLKDDIKTYQKITDFDNVAARYVRNFAETAMDFDETGFTGQSFGVQQQIPVDTDVGAFWGNGTLNLDDDQNVTGGNVGVNYVGIPGTYKGLDYVAIANANVNIPKDGNLTAANASFLAGGILKSHGDPDATNHTVAAIVNGIGDPTAYYRPSKPIIRNGNLTVTAYDINTFDVNSKSLGVTGGMHVEYNTGKGKAVYADGSVTVSDVLGNKDTTGKLGLGYAHGNAGKNQTELEAGLIKATSVPDLASHRLSAVSLRLGMDEAAKVYATLPPESQAKLVNDIATNLIPAETFSSAEDAKNYVTNELHSRTQMQDQGASPGG